MPHVEPQQRAMAINRLLSMGQLDLLRSNAGLLYRLKDAQSAGKMKGSDNQEKLVYQIIEDAGNKVDVKPGRMQEDSSPSRKRKLNFSSEETDLLIEEILKHEDALYGRGSVKVTPYQKDKIWRDIQFKINSLGYCEREVEDLKRRWRDLRRRCKERVAKLRRSHQATDDGPSTTHDISRREQIIVATLTEEAVQGVSGYDTLQMSRPLVTNHVHAETALQYSMSAILQQKQTSSESLQDSSSATLYGNSTTASCPQITVIKEPPMDDTPVLDSASTFQQCDANEEVVLGFVSPDVPTSGGSVESDGAGSPTKFALVAPAGPPYHPNAGARRRHRRRFVQSEDFEVSERDILAVQQEQLHAMVEIRNELRALVSTVAELTAVIRERIPAQPEQRHTGTQCRTEERPILGTCSQSEAVCILDESEVCTVRPSSQPQ
ncbi:DNA-directed RNA polymerase III subunit RPC6 isoform X2 [Latimeria chalumnae]|nr:PREDICTED: DNA-directed RNA polymerase III subunit RPC6 isoform X2 [Latimeria chalumnae]|eukprot:XP_014342095.1 PREDICTED: DNA-directed RNA polymerase III subunit RPC6 isoform X2 [Latimeria chalumnae]